jgi:hypothetical protein
MSVFTSKWDAWTPQTQKNRTDSTDNAPSDTAMSVLSVQKNRVLPDPKECPEAGKEPLIDPFCLICGQPADDSNANLVAHPDGDKRLLRLHIAPECYRTWFERTFGRPPKPAVLPITKLPKP